MPVQSRRAFLGSLVAAGWGALLRRPDDLQERIPALLKEHAVPGAAAAVLGDGELAWSGAFGVADAKSGAPVTAETVFQAASLSKPVFAYAVLTLAAEGKLDLDRPLTSYLDNPYRSRQPGLMASAVPPDPRLADVTPRIVLRHATGFPNWARGEPLTFAFNPGERFGYSGEGYVYLQNVIEHVAGKELASFVEERALSPLGMDSSSFVWRPDYDGRAAIGHTAEGPREKWRPRSAFASGTLHTTATDYAAFLAAMIRPRAGIGLDESWLRRMLAPETRIDDSLSWGLGWGLERNPAGRFFWQWGDDGEFKAFAVGHRESGAALVVLTNGETGLRVCRRVIERALPGRHSMLSFERLDY